MELLHYVKNEKTKNIKLTQLHIFGFCGERIMGASWFQLDWMLLIPSPSLYTNPKGLSYILYVQAADEQNQ